MNFRYLLFVWMTLILMVTSCDSKVELVSISGDFDELIYDSTNAQKYGADEYGMKKYVMAFLKRGSNRSLDADSSNALQMGHMENISRMAEEGKLVLAGPFFGDQDLRGIYIFNVATIEEAEALTNSDPAIQAGVLEMELMEWYGSAALMAVNDIHNSLSKREIIEE